MTRFLLLTTLLSLTSILDADPPAKRGGGLFGFGAQKSEQISGGLFPERRDEATASHTIVTSSANTPAPASAAGGNEIFRSGQPRPVDAVSYVIQNGRKIERPIESVTPAAPTAVTRSAPVAQATATEGSGIELASGEGRKRGGFFAFGRRGDNSGENEVVTPVPATNDFAPPRAAPAPLVAAPTTPSKPVEEAAETPDFAGVEKEKEGRFGWIPFLSRKKEENAPAREAAAPAVIAAAQPVPLATPAAPAQTTPAKPVASKPAAATTAAASAPSTTFEVPRDETKKEEKKEAKPGSSGSGILSPIANIRPPRKEIDLSSAETIIQDGEIVAGSETTFETVTDSGSSGQRQAPQIVNGVKTYSSWDDVNARSSSAADKIIGSMR